MSVENIDSQGKSVIAALYGPGEDGKDYHLTGLATARCYRNEAC